MVDETASVGVNGSDVILVAVQERLAHITKWWHRLWGWHCWLTGATVIMAGIVPFGLGLLLYTPQEYLRNLNIALIVLTAGGFVAQVWNLTQRHRDRALHLRAVAATLETAILSFRSGLIGKEELAKVAHDAYAREAEEPIP